MSYANASVRHPLEFSLNILLLKIFGALSKDTQPTEIYVNILTYVPSRNRSPFVRVHFYQGNVCHAISKLRQLLWSVAHVINSVSVVCLSKHALKDCVYLLHYYSIFSFVFICQQVDYATGCICLVNKNIKKCCQCVILSTGDWSLKSDSIIFSSEFKKQKTKHMYKQQIPTATENCQIRLTHTDCAIIKN